jgi:hypothetical protein
MVAWIEEATCSRALAVLTFHRVAGWEHHVAREEHQKLLTWVHQNRKLIWTALFVRLVEHLAAGRM